MPNYPSDFERAWNEYPKRDGKRQGKYPAFKAWKKMSAEEKSAARERIGRMNQHSAWGKYIRNMATWLNAKGWEDEVAFPRARPAPEPAQSATEAAPLPWYERVLNRVWMSWCLRAGGVCPADCERRTSFEPCEEHTEAAKRERADILRRDVPAFTEELQAGNMTKNEAAVELAGLFCNRLDLAYGRNIRRSVMQGLTGRRHGNESDTANTSQASQ